MTLVRRLALGRRAAWVLLPLWCSLALHSAAAQQDLRPLLDRVQQMERDLTVLQQQVYGGRPPAGAAGAPSDTEATVAATVRMAQLESDLRATTGQLEEINFNVGQLRQRLDRLVSDVDFRLTELEKIASGHGGAPAAVAGAAPAAGVPNGAAPNGAAVAGAAVAGAPAAAAADAGAAAADSVPGATLGTPPRNLGTIPLSADRALPGAASVPPAPGAQTAAVPGGVAPTAIAPPAPVPPVRLPSGSPKDQYDYAFDLLKRAEYAQAEQALRQFVTAYPNDPLAGNAQYWLGETYYVRNNYSEAAAQFLKGYQSYPQSPKAADNLFKLGLTLTILGKVQEACSAYQRFDREYASAAGSLKRRVVDERQRLGCA